MPKIHFTVKNGAWGNETDQKIIDFLTKNEGKECTIELKKIQNKRTNLQNNSMWLFCEQIAQEVNDRSIPFGYMLGKLKIEAISTKKTVMETLWRRLMIAMTGKHSTTQMTTLECIKIGDYISEMLRKNFDININFPNKKELSVHNKQLPIKQT